MSTLELCEKYFETRDVYKLLGINKNAQEKEIKKAYHKLSLLVHPDRVAESQKEESTEKFKVLSKIYQVLTDKTTRALYDEQGIIDDDDEGKLSSWLELWKTLFKPITEEDISNYEKEYVNSPLERTDVKRSYLGGQGCINYIMNHVPFMKVEDEPRIKEIVLEMIAADEVPEYKMFTEEPAAKRNRRHKKYARESLEAKAIMKQMQERKKRQDEEDLQASDGNLQQLILARNQKRESNYKSMMDSLFEKYGGEDTSPTLNLSDLGKKKKSKIPVKQTNKKNKLNSVQNGKVEKSKK